MDKMGLEVQLGKAGEEMEGIEGRVVEAVGGVKGGLCGSEEVVRVVAKGQERKAVL